MRMKKKKDTETRETVVNSLKRPCSSTAEAASAADCVCCSCYRNEVFVLYCIYSRDSCCIDERLITKDVREHAMHTIKRILYTITNLLL
jgi:hypothetical protein